MVYPTYQLDCKNSAFRFGAHQIEIPLPTQVTLGGVTPSRDHIQNVAFACPLCHHVYSYDGRDLKHRVLDASAGQLPATPVPVCAKVLCQEHGCRECVAIYTTRHPSEDKQKVLERLRTCSFHTQCPRGHLVNFSTVESCVIADGPLCNPF